MYDIKDRALLAPARSLGVHDALPKPFDIGQLVARVEALAGAARPQLDDSVLVVSPHTDERYALHHLLDGRYRTRTVASAEAAAEVAENAFDVAIIDVDAQEYSWEAVVKLLRTKNRRIKVLALAGRDEAAAAATSGEGGVAAAMVKPYAVDDLLTRVRDLLGIRQIDGSILRSVFRKVAT
jgi:DNA-binding response OmpR family regulator